MKQKITITQVLTTVRTVFVEQGDDTIGDLQRLVALGVNNLGFDNVGELVSQEMKEFVDDINVDCLDC
tara:strand:- start:82 stop:285 length:204 start_codon:yes stop_codon:yes gene_type:complete